MTTDTITTTDPETIPVPISEPAAREHECAGCGDPFTGTPVLDKVEVFMLGEAKARTWCTADCLDDYAERSWGG